jgi:iron complex transport system ATP-binding protein
VAVALRRAAAIGGFFDLPVHPDTASAGPDWCRYADVTGPGGEPVLTAMLADHARRLRTRESRVAASLFFQGCAARVWSPVLASLRNGVVPDLDPAVLWLQCRPGAPVTLRLSAVGGWAGTSADLVAAVVLDRLLDPMIRALRRLTAVAPGLLWGNAASALAGSLQVLVGHDPSCATSRAVAARLLAAGPLAGTGMLSDRYGHPAFRRRSCCLYYRVPGGGLCVDCALTRPPAPRATPLPRR